ncbi:YrrS family protein [Halobacillus naozhouensis]|uniref:YrrS family protein n=1 Tax=Halobacillus naozhouensis TaxID=554880 RepID=A0ABY8ITH4_9BACI|nr:YrrS family protein [Halobacillus naozhouensis]WFT73333.1 YrrS family protein [Halobacillus naozhouensis]
MSEKESSFSRANRFEKKRKGTRLVTWLAGAGALLIVVFIASFIFGGESEQTASNQQADNGNSSNDQELNVITDEQEEQDSESSQQKDKEQEKNKKEEDAVIKESDKKNVDRVITKDWEPVATEQQTSGNHTVTYEKSSQDWQEILQAASKATSIDTSNMIAWRVENGGGPQKVEATVSDKAQQQTYRVYIHWVEGAGYKPVKVEELASNPYQ